MAINLWLLLLSQQLLKLPFAFFQFDESIFDSMAFISEPLLLNLLFYPLD